MYLIPGIIKAQIWHVQNIFVRHEIYYVKLSFPSLSWQHESMIKATPKF